MINKICSKYSEQLISPKNTNSFVVNILQPKWVIEIYIWFCGDDDEYFFDSVKRVIEILQNNNIEGAYLNQVNPMGYSTFVEKEGCYSLNDFFKIVKYDPEFISTVVVKKTSINVKIPFNTWYHLDCLANMKEDSCLYVMKNPWVLNKLPNTNSWNKNSKNALLYAFEQIELYEKSNLSEDRKKNLTKIYVEFVIDKIINIQIKRILSKNEINLFIQKVLSINFNKDLKKFLIKLLNSRFYCIFYATKNKRNLSKRNFLSRIIKILKIYQQSNKFIYKCVTSNQKALDVIED